VERENSRVETAVQEGVELSRQVNLTYVKRARVGGGGTSNEGRCEIVRITGKFD